MKKLWYWIGGAVILLIVIGALEYHGDLDSLRHPFSLSTGEEVADSTNESGNQLEALIEDVPVQLPDPVIARSYEPFQMLPIDEAAEDTNLLAFREALLDAVEDRNIQFLEDHLAENGKYGFDGTTKELLLETWDESMWIEMDKAVGLGGIFFDEEKTEFITPYTFKGFPDNYDGFEFNVAISSDVKVYEIKDISSTVIDTLNYSVVKVPAMYEDELWTIVELPSGKLGYVKSEEIRSPIDYRVYFTKKPDSGEWEITGMLVGD